MMARYSENLPILYRNIMDGMPDDFTKDVFLWAAEQPGNDRHCYRAEEFAHEVKRLLDVSTQLVALAEFAAFKIRSRPLMEDQQRRDLLSFLLVRHANGRWGQNTRPPYSQKVAA